MKKPDEAETEVKPKGKRVISPFDFTPPPMPEMPVTKRSPLRNILDDYIWWGSKRRAIIAFTSFDATPFTSFCERCKAEGRRPPSLVVYFVRCCGALAPDNKWMMSSKHKKGIFVPEDLNVLLMVSAHTHDGEDMPLFTDIRKVQELDMAGVAAATSDRVRSLRRDCSRNSPAFERMSKWGRYPAIVRRGFYVLSTALPHVRHSMSVHQSHLSITSLTDAMPGRSGWGVPIMPTTLSIGLGGLSRRPAVVDGEIVARDFLDVSFQFDHELGDGVPTLEVMHKFGLEFESGRLLEEYFLDPSAKPRNRKRGGKAEGGTGTDAESGEREAESGSQ